MTNEHKGESYPVNQNSAESSTSDGFSVFWVFRTGHHAVVVGPEEEAEDGEDDDCEYGYNDAVVGCVSLVFIVVRE